MSNRRYNIQSQNIQKLNSKLLYISMSKYEGDWHSIPHTHHFTELIYILSGKGCFLLNEQVYPITSDDLIIVTPNTEHTEQSLDANPLEYIVLGIEGITFLEKGGENEAVHILCNYSHKTELRTILNMLLMEAQHEQYGYQLICQNLLEILLVYITRTQMLIPASVGSAKMTKECGQIKRYLDSNYSDSITLDTLADMTHMNKYYLVHAFNRYTGLSPINYLNSRRLKVSEELLTTTNHSIAQIAGLVGFSSQSYFAQVFKKEKGITPNEYRRSNTPKEDAS